MNTSKLRGIMAEKNKTGKAIAEYLGMSAKTFYLKMKKDKFGIDEAKAIKDLLEMNDQLFIEIFLSD